MYYVKVDTHGNNVICEHFNGPHAFSVYCAGTQPSKSWLKSGAASKASQSNWNGEISWSESIKLCMNGWRNGWEDISQDMVTIEDEEKPIRPRITLNPGYSGSRPSVSRVIAGVPKQMIRAARPRVNAPAVKLIVSIGALSSVDAEAYKRRGAAVCAYIDAVETAGISTEIVALSRASAGHKAVAEVSVQLKQPGQPLDVDAVAFCLGHPAMLRRLVFRWREKEMLWKDFHYGYGRSCNPEEEEGALRINTMTEDDNHLSAQEWYDNISEAVAQERLSL